MENLSQLEKISQKYSVSPEDFIRSGIVSNLEEKQRLLRIERFEMLARYRASSIDELEQKVAEGKVAEHPGWEDLIELKNIEHEMEEISSDIRSL